MNIHQMEYFHVIATIGNMTKAAEYLHVAQPALSSALARISEEVGYPLFVKRGRNIVLSSQGEIFLRHITKILEEYNAALYEMQEVDFQAQKTLRLGVTGTSFSRNYQKSFHEEFPNITISQTLIPSNKIAEALFDKQELDFVFCSTEIERADISSLIIEYEPLYLEENLGIALINKTAIQTGMYNKGCRVIPITEPRCERPISLLWRRDKKMSPVAKQFYEFVKHNLCKL
ncbi:MAG: LysR family transcriptional regulator [Phascolarctobacterium sp.]|uniref:LysR family transcriptional regulator n=1 Tax=Phascolarctobacterium sp. TaxID=2049039 RepID=UPI0026DD7D77|nr:LysR family transcriptional regulator [Phascolarctobacterium sp.]MDO4921082.1 LysR family transcriptional regulator [Phascolarctobacterium sp.]